MYDELGADYMRVPERVNAATMMVDRHVAAGHGERIAVLEGDRRVTYARLAADMNRFGNALKQLGVGVGDHVLIRQALTLEALVAFLGATKIGAVPVPTSILLGPREIQRIAESADAVVAVVSQDLRPALDEVRADLPLLRDLIVVGEAGPGEQAFADLLAAAAPELAPADMHKNDPWFILYTSGSTGEPKGVERAHRMIVAAGDVNGKALMQLQPHDVAYQPHQDLSFSYPIGHGLLFPLYMGCTAVICAGRHPDGHFDPELVFAALAQHRVTAFTAAVAVFKRLLEVPDAERRYDLSALRFTSCAAEPLPVETYKEWQRRFGLRLYETMGQSEVPSFVGFLPGVPPREGALGKAFTGVNVTVVDDRGQEVAPNAVGHLAIAADYEGLCLGYRKAPDKWAKVCHDGWYFTQDQAYKDEDGYIWYVCRTDEVVKVRGYTVAPKEVENVLMEHPAVHDVAVVGVTLNDQQRLKAFVVPEPGYPTSDALATELREHCRHLLAAYKVPAAVEFRDDLPKTGTGKVLRRALLNS